MHTNCMHPWVKYVAHQGFDNDQVAHVSLYCLLLTTYYLLLAYNLLISHLLILAHREWGLEVDQVAIETVMLAQGAECLGRRVHLAQ